MFGQFGGGVGEFFLGAVVEDVFVFDIDVIGALEHAIQNTVEIFADAGGGDAVL